MWVELLQTLEGQQFSKAMGATQPVTELVIFNVGGIFTKFRRATVFHSHGLLKVHMLIPNGTLVFDSHEKCESIC